MKILLAIDGSGPSQDAIAEVIARTWPAGSTLDVVTVIEPVHLWTTSESAAAAYRSRADLLRSTLERLRHAGFDADGDILHGDPKATILNRAEQVKANFIVLGSHSVSAVEHFLLGNVAANVLRHAGCTVLIARSAPSNARKILLPTDGSSFSQAAARSVAERKWPDGTSFRVLSVVEFIVPPLQSLFEPPFVESRQIETLREEAMRHAQDAVAASVTTLSRHHSDVSESISVLLDGPREIILNEAEQWGADLIVLGSHGRRGSERFFLGSVSEGVATRARCSVEVVRTLAPFGL